jgi:hypothetical protein
MRPSTQPLGDQPQDTPGDAELVMGMVPSAFITKLRSEFISEEQMRKLWNTAFAPAEARDRKKLIANDIASAFRSLFLATETGADPETGVTNSAAELVKKILEETQWPDGPTVPVPAPFASRPDQFRRYEVGCAVVIMMHAYHRHGPGGPPTDFPPTRPP